MFVKWNLKIRADQLGHLYSAECE